MIISTKSIVSTSDMIKNYRLCREKAESTGKVFVFKNNEPDAVLISMNEYERIYAFIEHMESLDENDLAKLTALIQAHRYRK